MEEAVIAFIIKEIMSPAADAAVKTWLLTKLKSLEATQKSAVVVAVIEAVELFISTAA